LDEEYDTDLSQLAESSERNTDLKPSKKNCLGEGAKQKKFEHSWDMVSNILNYNLLYYNNMISFLFTLY